MTVKLLSSVGKTTLLDGRSGLSVVAITGEVTEPPTSIDVWPSLPAVGVEVGPVLEGGLGTTGAQIRSYNFHGLRDDALNRLALREVSTRVGLLMSELD